MHRAPVLVQNTHITLSHTHTHTHIEESRNSSLPLLPGYEGYNLTSYVPYLFSADEQGVQLSVRPGLRTKDLSIVSRTHYTLALYITNDAYNFKSTEKEIFSLYHYLDYVAYFSLLSAFYYTTFHLREKANL